MAVSVKQISNPFSTGGGGSNFENRIQASFAVLMLAEGYAPCIRLWPIKSIHLQAKYAGYHTDDLVVEANDPSSGKVARLLGQVKHDVAFTRKNKVFSEVIAAAWHDFTHKLDRSLDAIALITGPLNGTDLELRTILEWARTSATEADFFSKVNLAKFSSKNKNEKLNAIIHHLTQANGGVDLSNDEVWTFLKVFHVLQYDLDIAGGVNRAFLTCIISQFGTTGADGAWAQLIEAVRDINQNAGSVTKETLPSSLVEAFARRPTAQFSSAFLDVAQLDKAPTRPPVSLSVEVAIAQFVGAWNENSESDRSYVAALAGDKYDDYVRRLSLELIREGSVVRHKSGVWSVTSRKELWVAFGSFIFDRHITELKKHAQFALSQDDLLMSSEVGDSECAGYSRQLRISFSETLALMATSGKSLQHCQVGTVEATPGIVARAILQPNNWLRWASLTSILPTLAEAAPEAFLDALESALISGETFPQLFSQETDGIMGVNNLTGILWGLEALAWSPDYLARVTLILAGIDAVDPGGRWTDRAIESLITIYLPWLPQTAAPSSKRKAALKTLIEEHPDAAWRIYAASLPNVTRSSSGSHRPLWRRYDDTQMVSKEQYWTDINEYAGQLVRMAEADNNRLEPLIQHFSDLPEDAFTKAIELVSVSEVVISSSALRYEIWNGLNEIIRKHSFFSTALWAMPEELVRKMQDLADKLQPVDPAELYRDLFVPGNPYYDTEITWQEHEKNLELSQLEAVSEIWLAEGFRGVQRFALSVEDARAVGEALAKVVSAEVKIDELKNWAASADTKILAFLQGFVARRYQQRGAEWLSNLALSTWANQVAANILVGLPFSRATWQFARKTLRNNEHLYWDKVDVRHTENDVDLHFVVERLLRYNRPRSALEALFSFWFRYKALDQKDAIKCLLALGSGAEKLVYLDAYKIESIIKHLQEQPTCPLDELQKIEWAYLDLLEGPSRQTFPKTLELRLANDPAFFHEVISTAFRSDSSPPRELSEEDSRVALRAYRLLMGWRTPPGQGKSGEFSGERFLSWLQEATGLTQASGHFAVAMQKVGQVLINVPPDGTGLWIDKLVAKALNEPQADNLRSGYSIGFYNSRGVHWVDPTGAPERELADDFNRKAEELELASFIRLATTLRGIAKSYIRDAEMVATRFDLDGE